MDKNSIKNLLANTFVTEAKVPGLDVTNKAKSESGKQTKKAIKDIESSLSDYDKESKDMAKDSINPVKFNYTSGSQEEYHQEMEIMNGQEMIQYDRAPSDKFKERAEEAIAGSSNMGNNPEWANVVAKGQGGDPEFGKKLVKAIKSSEKKRSDGTSTAKMFGDDWEVVEDKGHKPYAFENKKNTKEMIKESNKMKRLIFKKPFNGVGAALNLIPESYKVDNRVFELTDGNESYRVRWEGSLTEGKAVVLLANNKEMVNEDMQKMKHLMGYKSQDTFGNLKGAERLNEDKNFSDIWRKTKSMLTEGMDEWSKKQLATFDKDGDGTSFEPEDMSALRKEEMMGGMSKDAERLDTMLGKNSTLTAAIGKINTKQELIDTMTMIYGDILKNNPQLVSSEMALLASLKEKGKSMAGQTPEMGTPEGGMYEVDRFDEVFSGLEEDMSEGMLYEGRFKISNLLTTAKQIADKLLPTLTDEDKQVIMNAGQQISTKIGDPRSIISKLGGVSQIDSEAEAELASQTPQLAEGWWGDIGKRWASRFSALVGAPVALITSIIGMGATGYNTWGDSAFLTKVHDMVESTVGQAGGPLSILLFFLTFVFLFLGAANWNVGKDN